MTSVALAPELPAAVPSELIEYLKIMRADHVPHSGRTLLDHLCGTYRILRSWECAPAVCVAGLFHSIYGTNAFEMRRLDEVDRSLVIRMIGEEAEELVYLFCASHRPDAFLKATKSHVLAHRHSGEQLPVTLAKCSALLEIECANLIEQACPNHFLQRLHMWLRSNAGTRVCPALQAAAKSASEESSAAGAVVGGKDLRT